MARKKVAKKSPKQETVKKTKKEPVKEIFEVSKEGEEKIIEKDVRIKEPVVSDKEQIKEENKILRNVLIGVGIFVVFVLVFVVASKIISNFEYKGVKFDVVKEGNLILYHTTFPVTYQGELMDFNIYLRNDPRKLEKKVPAKGTLLKIDDTVLNITEEFDCNGDEIIAIANLVNIYNAIGKKIIKDENASCDPLGRYMFIKIQPGNVTNIENFGPNCYRLNVNNCEILEVTERYILGMLVRINIPQ